MRPLGHLGTGGGFPTDKDSRAYGGSYRRVVRLRPIPFQCSLNEHECRCSPRGGTLYSFPKISRRVWSSLLLTKPTWNGCGRGIPRPSSILSLILSNFWASNSAPGCLLPTNKRTFGQKLLFE